MGVAVGSRIIEIDQHKMATVDVGGKLSLKSALPLC